MARKLTAYQAKFVELMIEGKHQQSDCYKMSGYKTDGHSRQTTSSNAEKLVKLPHVAEAIAVGRAKTAEMASITAMDIVDELEDARAMAKADRDCGAMVRASMGKAKVLGLDKIVVELVGVESFDAL